MASATTISPSTVKAQSILFASLAVTLFAAFITILGRQWILHYKETSWWGIVVRPGKAREPKFVGLQRGGLHFIMESLPFLLLLALLLFGVGLTVYLWDLDLPAAESMLAVTAIEFAFYAFTTALATARSDYPFQTPLSSLLSKIFPHAKKVLPAQNRRGRSFQTHVSVFLSSVRSLLKRGFTDLVDRKTTPTQVADNEDYPMRLSNPAFWRQDPLFTSPIPADVQASAGFWLLEDYRGISNDRVAAVAAVFPDLQWLSCHTSREALIRFKYAYKECFGAPPFKESARLKALQSAAAYYVFYHAQLISNASKGHKVEAEGHPYLPPDLLLYKHCEIWDKCDLFGYLLQLKDRSESVESAQFLSYVAPYWFCGDSDAAIRSRPDRLPVLYDLFRVLENSGNIDPQALTNCVLCVGAAMDFPLHPEDLIRVDKRYVSLLEALRAVLIGSSKYLVSTFEMVVEHIHQIILARSGRYDHAVQAMQILLTIAKHTWVPLVNIAWMNELLKRAVEGGMTDEHLTLFLGLSARRKILGDAMVDTEVGDFVIIRRFEGNPRPLGSTATSQAPITDDILFRKIMTYIQDRVEQTNGWQNDERAIFGGLIAIRDMEHPDFDDDTLRTLHEAMINGNSLQIRQVAYEVALVTQDHWIKSETVRQQLRDLDFFKQLYLTTPIALPDPDYQRLLLKMTETLSEDVYWSSHVRDAMYIWLPLRNEGPDHIVHIIGNISGGVPFAEWDYRSLSLLDDSLRQLLVDEWASVPARHVSGLTAEKLGQLAETTKEFQEVLPDDDYRRSVLAKVEEVIPGLKRRREDGYEGPGEDVCRIVSDLVAKLRPPHERRSSND